MLPSALLPVWQSSRSNASGEPRASGVSQSQGHLPPSTPRSEVPVLAWRLGSELQNTDPTQQPGAKVSGLPPPQGLQGLWALRRFQVAGRVLSRQ